MKIFHFREKLASLPREAHGILPPLHVRIKPTNICNHNCWYCAYRCQNLQLGQDMNLQESIPQEKMIEIIQDLGALGVQAVTFSGGGDPLCYLHLQPALERLIEKGISFAALTNGSRLSGSIAELFAHHGTWIRVSMDGWDDESYANYRGCAVGEFSRIMANMARFKEANGPCYLGVSIVVDQRNHDHLLDLIARLRDTGVNSVKVSPCIVSNNGSENNHYHEPLFPVVKDQLARAAADFSSPDFEIFDSYHTELNSFAKGYTWCPYLQITPVIGADLGVYACHDKAYNLENGLLGSIREMRFKDFWSSDKQKFFRIDPSIDCNHHCVIDGSNRQILEYLEADPAHLAFV